ncbi:MAG TPA: nitrilase-related carbon-nitrogen hydrolase, partial [Nocardioidaceae bacterium]
MRAFTAAALQVRPQPGPLTAESITANVDHCVTWVRDCVAETAAELVVLPETCTTGFTPDMGPDELWQLVDVIPGAQTRPLHDVAAELGVHLVYGAYAR